MYIYVVVGKTTQEMVDCDVMLENAMDFRNGTVRLAYNPEYVRLFAVFVDFEDHILIIYNLK